MILAALSEKRLRTYSSEMTNLGEIRNSWKITLHEDFSNYEEGPFSEGYTAAGEFHYPPKRIDQGCWQEVSTHHLWAESRHLDYPNWKIITKNNHKVLKQTLLNPLNSRNWKYPIKKLFFKSRLQRILAFPALATGDSGWDDYLIEVQCTPLAKRRITGVLFRMVNSQHHYIFALKMNLALLLKRASDTLKMVAFKWFPFKLGEFYSLTVLARGSTLLCFVDERPVLEIEDDSYQHGRLGLIADGPSLFSRVDVYRKPMPHVPASPGRSHTNPKRIVPEHHVPAMKLLRKVSLPNHPSGRSIRFGDLTGDGRTDILLAQGTELPADQYMIHCLTAIDLDGNILWRRGEPTGDRETLAADLAFQIYDIDDDGLNEVVCTMNFEILILDGRTGEVKARVPTPRPSGSAAGYPGIVGDSIYVANLSGRRRPQDILLKDRYSRLYALNHQLEPLWQYACNTGHYPFARDINDDGRDEILVGHTLLDSEGRRLAELPLTDHADAVAMVKFSGADGYVIIVAASDEGLVLADLKGHIRRHVRLGHAQTVTVARLCHDILEFQIATNTYWGNPGVITILNERGELLRSFQPSTYGSPLVPVNWAGNGSHLILLSAAPNQEGGLYDGYGRQLVSFPDDGHPTLCVDTLDITGNCLDDLVCWDHDELWIYGQESFGSAYEVKGSSLLPPRYNASNYRAYTAI